MASSSLWLAKERAFWWIVRLQLLPDSWWTRPSTIMIELWRQTMWGQNVPSDTNVAAGGNVASKCGVRHRLDQTGFQEMCLQKIFSGRQESETATLYAAALKSVATLIRKKCVSLHLWPQRILTDSGLFFFWGFCLHTFLTAGCSKQVRSGLSRGPFHKPTGKTNQIFLTEMDFWRPIRYVPVGHHRKIRGTQPSCGSVGIFCATMV